MKVIYFIVNCIASQIIFTFFAVFWPLVVLSDFMFSSPANGEPWEFLCSRPTWMKS